MPNKLQIENFFSRKKGIAQNILKKLRVMAVVHYTSLFVALFACQVNVSCCVTFRENC